MMLKIQIINGPNLNLLGKRETEIYGSTSFETFFEQLKEDYKHIQLHYFQSNIEGEIINKIHDTGFDFDGILLNAGAYTHTSAAIADAVAAVNSPVIEIHMTNIISREDFRHKSLIGIYCKGNIMGFGLNSYRLGIESIILMRY